MVNSEGIIETRPEERFHIGIFQIGKQELGSMKKRIQVMKVLRFWLMILAFFAGAVVLTRWPAQSQAIPEQGTQTQTTETQKTNVKEYIELLGSDVQQEKAQIMGAVLRLNNEEAEKFWPIYDEYEAELTKLNQQRAQNIQDYARSYSQLSDERANGLVKAELDSMKQRTELANKYHERVKASLGAVNAARFFEIDGQLNSIIDLQLDSSLPLGQD